MPDNKPKKVAEWDEEVTDVAPQKVDEWDEEVSDSPKPIAPSTQGGESGAGQQTSPSRSQSGSVSSLGSWTTVANPFSPTQAKETPKYEPSNFAEILKKADIGVINPDLETRPNIPTEGLVNVPISEEAKASSEAKRKQAEDIAKGDIDLCYIVTGKQIGRAHV